MNQLLIAYWQEHERCPKCSSLDIESTCLGCSITPDGEYMDTNRARCCSCGWQGIVHDLTPKEQHKDASTPAPGAAGDKNRHQHIRLSI